MTYVGVDVIVRSCVALASFAFCTSDAFDPSGENEERQLSSSSSLVMTAIVASFALSIAGVVIVICCFFFKKKRRRSQVTEEDDLTTGEKTAVHGKRWHQVDGARFGNNNAGDAGFVGIHETPTVSMKNETLRQSTESKTPHRDLKSIGTKPSNGNMNLESEGKLTDERDSFHSSAEESEPGRLEAVTLTSEDNTGPGITIGKSSGGEIIVKDVATNGPAMKSKRVQQGDRISSLAISMENMTLEHARTLLDLAKYYPIELHLMRPSSDVDVCCQMSDFEESFEASFARLLQERSKSSSVNYLPTEDGDLPKSLERPIYSCSQLPASTELSTRWRFENQPHVGNLEDEADGRRNDEQLEWESTRKIDGENSEENRENLDEKSDMSDSEGTIPPSSSAVEEHDMQFTSPSNWSDMDFDFPALGLPTSESEWEQSILENILPHFSETKTEEQNKTNSADSEENEFSNFTLSSELKEHDDSFQDERLNNDKSSLDRLRENCSKHNSTVVTETAESQSEKYHQNSVKMRQEGVDFANQNAEKDVIINPSFRKHDVEISGQGAKSRSVMYGEEEDDDDNDYDDDDDDDDDDDESEEYEVTSSETNNMDLRLLSKVDTSGAANKDDSSTNVYPSAISSISREMGNGDDAVDEVNSAMASDESLRSKVGLKFPVMAHSMLSFEPLAETDQSPSTEEEQLTTISQTFYVDVPTAVPQKLIDHMEQRERAAEIVSPKIECPPNAGSQSNEAGTALSGNESKASYRLASALTRGFDQKSGPRGNKLKEFFSSKSSAKEMQTKGDVEFYGKPMVSMSSENSLAGSNDVLLKFLSKKNEVSDDCYQEGIESKPCYTNFGSTAVKLSQNVIADGENDENDAFSLEEIIADDDENLFRNKANETYDFQSNFERKTALEQEMAHPIDCEIAKPSEIIDRDSKSYNSINASVANGQEVQGQRFVSGGTAVTSSATLDDDRVLQANDVTEAQFNVADTTGASSNVKSSNDYDDPNWDFSDLFFNWSKLTLEPLELPKDYSGFSGTTEESTTNGGHADVNANVVGSKNCEVNSSANAIEFGGKETIEERSSY